MNWSKDGVALTAPDPVPTKEGHGIEGWYYDNNGTETKWNFDTDTVKCTMTLKAKWELSTYSVTLQTDGHRSSGKDTATLIALGQFLRPLLISPARDITLTAGTGEVFPSPVTEISATDTEIKHSTQMGETRLPSFPATRSIISEQ